MDRIPRLSSLVLLCLLCPAAAFGQLSTVRAKIDSIAGHARGIVGVAAIDLRSGDTVTVRGNARFPMQSVYKLPLALAVLDQVDRGALALDQTIHIVSSDLHPDTWSPLRERYPGGDIDLRLDSLLKYTVSYSDNNGCDILFRLLGGTGIVDRYVHRLGIVGISIVATEYEMHQKREVQYRNWSTPLAMARLLELFFNGSILSRRSRDVLWHVMACSAPGPGRIKGQLPSGVVVPHKTGSSGTDKRGVAAATNDVGIIPLPGDRFVALAVFVAESDAPDDERDLVISSVARAIWDGYTAP